MSSHSSDRRCFRRHDVDIHVQLSAEAPGVDDTTRLTEGRVQNISREGLYVRCRFLEPPGTTVHLTLQPTARGQCLYVDGKVVRTDEHAPGIGIRLERLIPVPRFDDLSRRTQG